MRIMSLWTWRFFAIALVGVVFTEGYTIHFRTFKTIELRQFSDLTEPYQISRGRHRRVLHQKLSYQETPRKLEPCEGFGTTRFCDVPDDEYPVDAIREVLMEYYKQRKTSPRVQTSLQMAVRHEEQISSFSKNQPILSGKGSILSIHGNNNKDSCLNKRCFLGKKETSCIEKKQTIRKTTTRNRTSYIVPINESYIQNINPRFPDRIDIHLLENFEKIDFTKDETQIACVGAHSICHLTDGSTTKCTQKTRSKLIGIVDYPDYTFRMEYVEIPDGCECITILNQN